MSEPYDPPTKIFGVDFSGAKDAGRKIWVTEAEIRDENEDQELVIESCQSLFERCDTARKCGESMAALVELVTGAEDAAFGFDFPFGVPSEALDGVGRWHEAVEEIAGREGAGEFYESCRNNASDSYVLRETDARHAALCPYSWLIYKQTYHGISGVLDEVSDDVAILPMDDITDGRTWLLEVYPAATLESLGLYRQGYKGRNGRKERREANLEGVIEKSVKLSDEEIRLCVEEDAGGDALDSLLAAYTVFRNVRDSPPETPEIDHTWEREGHIYV